MTASLSSIMSSLALSGFEYDGETKSSSLSAVCRHKKNLDHLIPQQYRWYVIHANGGIQCNDFRFSEGMGNRALLFAQLGSWSKGVLSSEVQ